VPGRETKGRRLSVQEVEKLRAEVTNFHQFTDVSESIVAVNRSDL
jgi:hypothetical protein